MFFPAIRSALLILHHLGEYKAAKIRNALEKVYRTREKLTRDVGGKAGTSEFADSIIEFMESESGVARLRPRLRTLYEAGDLRLADQHKKLRRRVRRLAKCADCSRANCRLSSVV